MPSVSNQRNRAGVPSHQGAKQESGGVTNPSESEVMSVLGNMRIGVRAMLSRPLRSFLVLQGVIWAAAIIVFPSAIEKGSVNNAVENASRFKTDQITIYLQDKEAADSLNLEDIEAIKQVMRGRKCSVTPFRVANGEIILPSRIIKTTVVGTNETSPETRSFHTSRGRYITAEDVREKKAVCVLESLAAKELFPQGSPINKTVAVRFENKLISLRVAGVMQKRDSDQLATDEYGFRKSGPSQGGKKKYRERFLDSMIKKLRYMTGIFFEGTEWKRTERCVHVPLTLLSYKDDSLDYLIVRTDPLQVIDSARRIQNALLARNKAPILLHNIFLPILMSDQLTVKDDLTAALFILCLILGGIVIMNIMLMSVMERNREIAIRRVEGASKNDIIWQFLIEGMILCFVGALLGIPLGLALAYVDSLFEPYAISAVGIPVKDVLISLASAVVLGVIAAILPARKAAQLDPVVILQNQ
jgi:ABC-type antimicrobial peptide transport system permease subunit